MSRKALTLRGGHTVTIGDAVMRVAWARRGEVHLVVEAPQETRIRVHPRQRPGDEPVVAVPSSPTVAAADDDIPF